MARPLHFARSRLTVFPLEHLTVAYTTQSSDRRGLGDIAVVGVVEPEGATGEHLWRLAASMYANPPTGQVQARWILTQCTRARIVKAPAYRDLTNAEWTGDLTREFRLDDLFANHTVLCTGRLTIR
ncbi:hypothetical protein FBY35_6352 [Streptomyces sp. SLBN-118]|uniref:hypothetical protein n=1 Tax=Streptomyces sp. SLBN-118 TaxID=2768454 RepID=UPI0011543E46|nr:hypothetical protein [Streptomyces sp. SLBN-118]TQK44825.1 hypothetical protein FBY35_6352 [Streptomyces sp. SLBN-118]